MFHEFVKEQAKAGLLGEQVEALLAVDAVIEQPLISLRVLLLD